MAYSTSPDTLWRMRNPLLEIARTGSARWDLGTAQEARKYAYRLREAVKIAERLGHVVPEVSAVAHLIKVSHATNSTVVVAEVRDPIEAAPQLLRPQHKATTDFELVVAAVREFKGETVTVYGVPELTEEQKSVLRHEALHPEDALMLLYSRSQQTLTIAVNDLNVPEEARL